MIAVYLPLVVYGFIGLDILTHGYLLPSVERLCEWLEISTSVTDLVFLKLASDGAGIVAMVAWAVWNSGLAVVDFSVDAALFGLLVNVGLAGLSSPVPIQLACRPLVRNAFFAALIVGTVAAVVYAPVPHAYVGTWWEGLVLLALFGTFVVFVVFGDEPFFAACRRFWPPQPPLGTAAVGRSLVRVTVNGEGPAGQDWGRNDRDGSPLEQPTGVPPSFPPSLSVLGPTVGSAVATDGDTLPAQSLPSPPLRAATGDGSVAVVDGEQEEPMRQEEAQAVASLGQRAQAADARPSRQAGHIGPSTPKALAEASNEAGAGGDLARASRSDSTLVRTRSRRLGSARCTAADAAAGVSGAAVTTADEERGGGDAANRSDDSAEPPPRCLTSLRLDWLVTVAGRLWSGVCFPWELLFRCTVVPCVDDRHSRWWPLTLVQAVLWVVAIVVSEMFVQTLLFNCAHPLVELQWTLLAIGTCPVRVSVGPRSTVDSRVWLLLAPRADRCSPALPIRVLTSTIA